ncbi:MAG TPA: hypothetical protein VK824_02545, partial [Planctomycetota bacterium]|nr:hypothetical protein [Planctomycetota bacterium]
PYFASAGDAIDLAFARVSLLGAELIGGDEGADNGATSTPGFALSGPFGDVDARDTTFAAGMVQGAGTPVPPLNLLSSSLVTYPASMRTLSIPCPLRELEPAFASVHGEPGDLAFVLVAATSDLASLPDKEGVLVVATTPQPLLLPLGTVSDASGQLDARIVLPRLPVGVDGMVLFTQLGVVSSQGDALLGTGSAVVWLSAAL